MTKSILHFLLAIGVTGAVALATIYVLTQDASAAVAEVLSCVVAGMTCANSE